MKAIIFFTLTLIFTGCNQQAPDTSNDTIQKEEADPVTLISESKKCKVFGEQGGMHPQFVGCTFKIDDGLVVNIAGIGRSPQVQVVGKSKRFAVAMKVAPPCIGVMNADSDTVAAIPFAFISPISGETYASEQECADVWQLWLEGMHQSGGPKI